jgi:TolA-binding protein
MNRSTPPPEDLPVLVRRGEAAPSERRRLDMVLGASRLERWLHALGCDYDQMETRCEGDEALLRRIVNRVAERQPVGSHRRGRRVAVALVAVAGFVTVGAAALTLPRIIETARSEQVAECVGCPPSKQDTTAATGNRTGASTQTAPVAAEQTSTPSLPGAASAAAKTAPAQAPPKSPAELFSDANALRKSGRTNAAVATYSRLQRQHPASSEARLSRVLLGRIFLQQGAADAAYRQFSSYLRSSPGGSLAEEAMHGQATALRMSGKTAEERRVYEQLIRRFPRSIYARRARERLQELD